VRSEVLTEVLLNFLVFEDVMLCWLVIIDHHFKRFNYLLLVLIDPEYRGIRVLGNISNCLPINMAKHPKRLGSSSV